MKHFRWPVLVPALLLGAISLVQWHRRPATAAPAEDSPKTSLSYQRRLGLETYRHYCETCHGVEGKGDGFNAFNLDPKPADFTASSFHAARSDEQLAAAIAGGGRSVGRSAGMPPWGHTLSPPLQRAVLLHIRRFGAGADVERAGAGRPGPERRTRN